jgi:hypothetical protein
MSGIPIGWFYHVNVDMDIPRQVYGGLGQWNLRRSEAAWKTAAFEMRNGRRSFLGMADAMRKDDSRYVFAMSQEVARLWTGSPAAANHRPVHPEGANLRFNWNAVLHKIRLPIRAIMGATTCIKAWTSVVHRLFLRT